MSPMSQPNAAQILYKLSRWLRFFHLGKYIEADTGCVFQICPVCFFISQQLPGFIVENRHRNSLFQI